MGIRFTDKSAKPTLSIQKRIISRPINRRFLLFSIHVTNYNVNLISNRICLLYYLKDINNEKQNIIVGLHSLSTYDLTQIDETQIDRYFESTHSVQVIKNNSNEKEYREM
ncbi:MAG: hypothetical protein IJS58_02345 [Bacilli bacterium]|nr:hypothetical protein [Bacilli bacterium]